EPVEARRQGLPDVRISFSWLCAVTLAQGFSEKFTYPPKPLPVLLSMRSVGVFYCLSLSETAKKTRHKID
ncbi:hypothetical protein, partial [Pseudomonas aeruginosa]|uniref:hypothetical protein n=4 Tax=Pseudomonas aeruginosa TaxID=287 RepID=UPI00396BCA32